MPKQKLSKPKQKLSKPKKLIILDENTEEENGIDQIIGEMVLAQNDINTSLKEMVEEEEIKNVKIKNVKIEDDTVVKDNNKEAIDKKRTELLRESEDGNMDYSPLYIKRESNKIVIKLHNS